MFTKSSRQKITKPIAEDIEFKNIDASLDVHQVTIIGDVPLTVGTLAVLTQTTVDSEFEPLQKDGADYSIVLIPNGIRSFYVPAASIVAIKLEPTVQCNGTEYTAKYIGGRKG